VTDRKDPFFLFIGSTVPDTATSSLKASGIHYRWKRLESLPDNWKQILEYLQDSVLIGVVVKLTSQNYESMVATKYASAALDIIESLGKVRHIVFVHESVLRGIDERPKLPDDPDHYTYLDYITSPFRPPEEEARLKVNRLLDEYEINLVPYRTNAEMSVLALAFIDENEKPAVQSLHSFWKAVGRRSRPALIALPRLVKRGQAPKSSAGRIPYPSGTSIRVLRGRITYARRTLT
jgi:hypothetical protein